ncbi:hypothetical protein T01_10078 [Trichinella spiralis]|uniref:Uncharacterized protein n=1 Tax=Trichinella spiralis TaxID=6334 RepID=A0A0V1B6D4_TRISP|nr:hypothetical protein T01_10078 [Trichinella spiralis]
MPCIGDRPKVTVTPGVTNGDEDGMRQSTAVTPVDDHSTSFCRTPPPFPGNGDLKIWLMRLVDYFQENTIPEEKRYGFTKLLFSDEGYECPEANYLTFQQRKQRPGETDDAVICNQFITDIRQEAVFEQLVRRGLANFEIAYVEAQEAEQTEATCA